MKTNFIGKMKQSGIIGNGRLILHNPLDSDRGKARDPHINLRTLKKLSNRYSDEIKDIVADNMIGRISLKGKSLNDFAGFGAITIAKVISKAKLSSKTDHQFISLFIASIPKEHLTDYVHFKEMLINLTGYPEVEGLSLATEAYHTLEPIMNEKILADIIKAEPSKKVYAMIIQNPWLPKIRDRFALSLLLGDFLNYNEISFSNFLNSDLTKVAEFLKPWSNMHRAILSEYSIFNNQMGQMLMDKLPKPEPRIKPNGISPTNIS